MKKEIFFDCSSIISYQEYKKYIEQLKKWYDKKHKKIIELYHDLLINKNLKDSLSIQQEHKKLIVELIKKVINIFDLKDKEIGIYLSNSFARGTNLLDSDIDINFLYANPDDSIYEELISSILWQVIGKYRDFIHDSISHRFIDKNNVGDIENVTYKIHFTDFDLIEEITPGNENLMYRLFNTKKDLNSFIKYYTEYLNDSEINEWIYFQVSLFDECKYLSYLFEYIKLHENKTSLFKVEVYKKRLIDDIMTEIKELKVIQRDDIRTIKKYYKNHIFKHINETLILLSKINKYDDFMPVIDRINLINNNKLIDDIKEYFGLIMTFNYLCDLYGIEFRTRYSHKIDKHFTNFCIKEYGSDIITEIANKALSIYNSLIETINEIKEEDVLNDKYIFNPQLEHINIANYSPLSHINNVSKCYQHDAYLLPFIIDGNKEIPIHPDTLDDLNIKRQDVLYYKLVYPTSSTRTVYVLDENICLKVGVQRQITRSIRDVKNKEIERSIIASRELSKYSYPDFNFLEEDCILNDNEKYNYIVRRMPNAKIYPWFYLIVTPKFNKDFMIDVIDKMVNIWMFYASKGIYFESAHTQNFLVDGNGCIYYRDLSDIRIMEYEIMRPSYMEELKDELELHSIFFDRSMLSQNIEHFIHYRKDLEQSDIDKIKAIIKEAIIKYNVKFPDYSMNYDKKREGHHPIQVEKSCLR